MIGYLLFIILLSLLAIYGLFTWKLEEHKPSQIQEVANQRALKAIHDASTGYGNG